MKPLCINSLLNKLITLTAAQDNIALETALIDIMNDFFTMSSGEKVTSTIIYNLKDEKKQIISSLSANEIIADTDIPEPMRQVIMSCFKLGGVCYYQNTELISTKFFPIKNTLDQTELVIGIEARFTDIDIDVTINLLLKIYQNFTALFNDNESDTLTGLLNRKTFDLKINKLLTQMQNSAKRKEDTPPQFYFLVIFDIDHFKRINDNFGHLIGDEVLLLFAQQMQQSFRNTDPLFRFGGEEFIGIFGFNNHDDIQIILERFRQKIEKFNFPQAGKVTISAGYTEILDFDTSSQLIDRADSALYFAKNKGRNHISCYEQLIADGSLQETKKQGDIEFF